MSNPNPDHGSAGLITASNHVPDQVTLPDLATLLANAAAHSSQADNSGQAGDVHPTLPTTSLAGEHAGQGIDVAASHVADHPVTLPDLVNLTGHDFFFHG